MSAPQKAQNGSVRVTESLARGLAKRTSRELDGRVSEVLARRNDNVGIRRWGPYARTLARDLSEALGPALVFMHVNKKRLLGCHFEVVPNIPGFCLYAIGLDRKGRVDYRHIGQVTRHASERFFERASIIEPALLFREFSLWADCLVRLGPQGIYAIGERSHLHTLTGLTPVKLDAGVVTATTWMPLEIGSSRSDAAREARKNRQLLFQYPA